MSGQEWIQMQQNGASLEEIRSAMNKRFNGKSTLKSKASYNSAYKKYARWEYFWRFQTDSEGRFISPGHVWDTWKEVDHQNKKSNLKMATANWSFLGPNVIPTATAAAYAGMGRLNAIAFHPSNVNIFWVGSANGGLWKTSDGGSTWSSAGGNLPVLGISDIAISSDANTLYIATGDADGGHSTSVGVLKSTDGGNTFVTTGLTNSATSDASAMYQVHHLWIDPTNSNTVVATTTNSIQRTTDGGVTWTNVDNFAASDIKQDPNDPSILYVGSLDAIIRSTDKGASWSGILYSMPDNNDNQQANKIDFAISEDNSNIIYAIADNGVGARSTNGGNNWSNMNLPANFNTQDGYNMAIIAAPDNANKVMVAGVSGWVSANGGSSWTQHLNGLWEQQGDQGMYIHSDHHMLKYQPGSNDIIFTVHDGGVHKGDFHDLNATWTDLSEGLFITQYYGMDGFPGDAGIIIGGAQDNDGSFLKAGTWLNINNNSDGIGGAINYNNSAISFCQSQEGFLNRTINSWVSDSNASPQPQDVDNDRADFVWPLEMDPTTPTILYAGYGNIYKSTDNGDSWVDITNQTNLAPYTSISVSPANSMVIYAVKSNTTISRSTDGGSTWSNLTSPSGVGSAMITNIEASLTDATKVYVTYGNYTAGAKVYVSTNSGGSWSNISTGIPNMPVFNIIEKAGSGDLYIGTQLGVYKRAADATSWTAFNTNLPAVSIRDLHIHENSSVLRAASFGRGIWMTSLSASSTCPSTATHIWTGSSNSSWHVATNWNTGCVPTSSSTIEIPDVTIDPIIANSITGLGGMITIKAGGHLTIQNGGILTASALSFTVDQSAQLTVDTGGVVNTP